MIFKHVKIKRAMMGNSQSSAKNPGFELNLPISLMLKSVILMTILIQPFTFGQQASLTGRVIEPNGSPVAGADIRLLGRDMAAVSGEDGRFAISVVGVNKNPSTEDKIRFFVSDGMFGISGMHDRMHVTIEFLDINGKKIGRIHERLFTRTGSTFNLNHLFRSRSDASIIILKAVINNKAAAAKILLTDGFSLGIEIPADHAGLCNIPLAKRLAVIDTLLVTKSGYEDKRVPIEDYDTDIGDIILGYVDDMDLDPAVWELFINDDFSNGLDRNVYRTFQGQVGASTITNFQNDDVYVDNGALVMRLQKRWNDAGGQSREYSGGGWSTIAAYTEIAAEFEIMGTDVPGLCGYTTTWPAGGEAIRCGWGAEDDFYEQLGKEPENILQTYHYWNDGCSHLHTGKTTVVEDAASSFHRYGVVRAEGTSRFYVDGGFTHSVNDYFEGNLRMNVGGGFWAGGPGSWPGEVDDGRLPAEIRIRHVKVWRKR
jgi:hypothetical protein